MTDHCYALRCTEPREHNLAWCSAHLSLADRDALYRFKYALSQLQQCPELKGQKFERCVLRLKESREEVQSSIRKAIAERQALG